MIAHNKELVGCTDHLILLEQLYVWGNFQLTWYQETWNVYGIVVGNVLTASLLQKRRSRWQNNIRIYHRKICYWRCLVEQDQYFVQWLTLCICSVRYLCCTTIELFKDFFAQIYMYSVFTGICDDSAYKMISSHSLHFSWKLKEFQKIRK